MSTIVELMGLVQAGKATASDLEQLASLAKEQSDSLKKVEQEVSKLVDSIKKAKIAPNILTNILAKEGLIVVPSDKKEVKTILFESEKMTFAGNDRPSSFRVWQGRDFSTETAKARANWGLIKQKGIDYFIAHLTAEGKEYYATPEGKKWIESLYS